MSDGVVRSSSAGSDAGEVHVPTSPVTFIQTYDTAATEVTAATATTLTDNSAGTANTTIQAMPDPADTPITADALRDDIVANLMPALRNNVADLTAQVNLLIADNLQLRKLINKLIDIDQSVGLAG